MKRKYLIGNLKMNLSSKEEADQYLSVLRREMTGRRFEHTEIVVAPPFIHLDRFHDGLPKNVALGAQDVFWGKEGSYTGEISVSMLKDVGAEYAIVGHSERRVYGGETDGMIADKVRAVLRSNLRPVLCIGETAEERSAGRIADVLETQLSGSLLDLSPLQAEKIVVAYEPRWAIGTDRIPGAEEILQAKVIIYRTLSDSCGTAVADRIPVLYGGSVKTVLLDSVCFGSQMDGVLVGRESLFPYEVVKMADRIEAHETELLVAKEGKTDKKS
jgi:triosephosphate isomerase